MNKTFEELSKKLDNEINLKEQAERMDAFIENEAESAGRSAAIGGAFKGAITGFLCGGFLSLIGSDSITQGVGVLIIIIGTVIGGYNGYDVAYRKKRYN